MIFSHLLLKANVDIVNAAVSYGVERIGFKKILTNAKARVKLYRAHDTDASSTKKANPVPKKC